MNLFHNTRFASLIQSIKYNSQHISWTIARNINDCTIIHHYNTSLWGAIHFPNVSITAITINLAHSRSMHYGHFHKTSPCRQSASSNIEDSYCHFMGAAAQYNRGFAPENPPDQIAAESKPNLSGTLCCKYSYYCSVTMKKAPGTWS